MAHSQLSFGTVFPETEALLLAKASAIDVFVLDDVKDILGEMPYKDLIDLRTAAAILLGLVDQTLSRGR